MKTKTTFLAAFVRLLQVLLAYPSVVLLPTLHIRQMIRKKNTTSPVHVVLACVREPITQRPNWSSPASH